MSSFARQVPRLFWLVSALLLLWAAVGLFAFYSHLTVDHPALAAMPVYDRQYYIALPGWFVYVFALAVLPAFAGAVALLMRFRVAWMFSLLSLVGVAAQFGWSLGATDIVAAKGLAAAGLPLVIVALALFQLWFATRAARRGWLR
ncbi:MAG: hypothetical protein WC803_00125 [Sphingomonas sp.]|jgi:hypothetical protein